jgi:hypothetical protein
MKKSLSILFLLLCFFLLLYTSSAFADGDPTPTATSHVPIEILFAEARTYDLGYGNYGGTGYVWFQIYLEEDLEGEMATATATPMVENEDPADFSQEISFQLLDREPERCQLSAEITDHPVFATKIFDRKEPGFWIFCDLSYYLNARLWTGELLFDAEKVFELEFSINKLVPTQIFQNSTSGTSSTGKAFTCGNCCAADDPTNCNTACCQTCYQVDYCGPGGGGGAGGEG